MKGFTNKTRIVLRALCALLLALLLIGPEIAQAGTVTIGQGSTRTYTAAAGGESFTVSLTDAYTSVFLQGKPGWVSCTKNGSKFSVEVSKNTGTSSRSGDVVFRDGNKIWTLRITQNGTPAPKKYTVSFNSNGGSSVSAITVTEGGTYGSLPTPTRTGYNFVGWFTAASGGTQITYGTRVTITSNQTLYAHWSAKSFTLSFNSNGGTAVSAKTITYDGTYGTLPAPTRTGYNFVGWFTAASGGTQITAGTRVTVTSNQTLYAHWSPKTITVRFYGNNGQYSTKSYTVGTAYGSLPAGPTPPTGNTFDGWYTQGSGGTKITTASIVPTTDTSLYAHWKAKVLTVSFDSRGGSSVTSINVTYGGTYGTLPTPTKTGYTFAGWYTAASGGTRIINTTKVTITANQKLYAHWTARTFTVTFNANGGTTPSPSTIKVTYDSTYGTLPTTTRTGYTFAGWFTAKSGGTQIKAAIKVVITANLTLYAQWKPKTITVRFYGTNGNYSTQNYTVGTKYGSFPANPTPPTGHKFAGWYTSGSGGTKITTNSTVPTTNTSLYAHWTPKTFTITFDSTGGTKSDAITVTYNSTYGTLPTTTRTGYTFNGWFTAKTGGTQIKASTKVTITANKTLYAQWTPKKVTIRFYGADGKYSTQTYTVGTKYGSLPAAPTAPTGYTFAGWYTQGSGGTKITINSTVPTTNTSLYAHWNAKKFKITFDSNGGTAVDPIQVTYDSTYGTLPSPTQPGHSFVGWFTAKSGGTQIKASTKVTITANRTLYAHWKIAEFTITFNSNGGSKVDAIKVTYASTYGTLPTPTRSGYDFQGWFTTAGGGTNIIASTKVTTTANQTLYAHWASTVSTAGFQFTSGSNLVPWTSTVNFRQFFTSSYNNQYDLVKASLETAMAAFDATEANSSLARYANIETLMNGHGFSRLTFNYPNPTYNSIGYAIGSRKIYNSSSGKTATLILVAIRGAGYGDEWGGNFNVYNQGGNNLNHNGFNIAATAVVNGLNNYINKYKAYFESNVKIWVVGYSRAGAVTNLVCSKIINNSLSMTIDSKNVFGFGFEPPRCTTDAAAHNSKYNGIKSFVNLSDFVPMVPMNDGKGWTFTRYGTTYSFPNSAGAVPGGVETAYRNILSKYIAKNKLQKELQTRLQQKTGNYANQSAYLSYIFNDLANATANPQQYYANGVQDLLVPVMAALMNAKTTNWLTNFSTIKNHLSNISTWGNASYGWNIVSQTALMDLLKNINSFKYSHFPELTLSWLTAYTNLANYGIIVP